MISVDMKMCRRIKKLTCDYSKIIFYRSGSGELSLVKDGGTPKESVPLTIPDSEAFGSFDRLADLGLIKLRKDIPEPNNRYFYVTPELVHRKAFLFDAFSKKFIGGFFSGAAVLIVAELVLYFIFKII